MTDAEVWSGRFEGRTANLLEVPGDVIVWIAGAIERRIAAGGAIAVRNKDQRALGPQDYVLQARIAISRYQGYKGVPLLSEALSLDPDFSPAHAFMAHSLIEQYWQCYDETLLASAYSHAQRALHLSEDAGDHHAMAYSLLTLRRYEEAGDHFELAAKFNPADVAVAIDLASWFAKIGQAGNRTAGWIGSPNLTLSCPTTPGRYMGECAVSARALR